jgi:hypothetical protein
MNLGVAYIDDLVTFYAQTQRFDTGVATAADSTPNYAVYEDETATPILTGTMAALGSATGYYSEQLTLSAANGFDRGKSYSVRIGATVNSVASAVLRFFKIATQSWDLARAGHNTTGTFGASIQSSGVVVATNNDKTGYAVGTGGITTLSFAAGAVDVAATAVALLAAIADKYLGRNVAGGSDGGRTVTQAYSALRNKVTRDATGFVAIYGTDDTTVSWTAVAATGSLGPIVSVDPA